MPVMSLVMFDFSIVIYRGNHLLILFQNAHLFLEWNPLAMPSDLCLMPFDLTAVPLHHTCPPPRRLLRHPWLPLCQRLALPPFPDPHPGVPHQRGLGQHLHLWAASGGLWRSRWGDPWGSRPGRWKCVQVSDGSVPASSAEAWLHPLHHVRQLVAQMPLSCRDK